MPKEEINAGRASLATGRQTPGGRRGGGGEAPPARPLTDTVIYPFGEGQGRGRGAYILSAASAVGGKEQEGPLGGCFDFCNPGDRYGQDTWEKAESEMQRIAMETAIGRAGVDTGGIGLLFAGDLLNQCVGSAYGLLSFDVPYCGLYGACSTCAESLLLASSFVGAGLVRYAAAVTSSHNAAAERQFRSPIEYGGQRPPTGQWTVTGAGAFIVTSEEELREGREERTQEPPRPAEKNRTPRPLCAVTACMPGIVTEMGISDANNMGAAMAPAAESTLLRFFRVTDTRPDDYDLIVTGDLGWEGGRILCDLIGADGVDIRRQYNDCGMLIYSRFTQDTHSGGSGCGCSAVVLASYLLPRIASGAIRSMLFMATGAMMSPDSVKQGQGIPGVAHLLRLENPDYARACGRI